MENSFTTGSLYTRTGKILPACQQEAVSVLKNFLVVYGHKSGYVVVIMMCADPVPRVLDAV